MNEEPRYDYIQFDDFEPWWERKAARWAMVVLLVLGLAGVVLAKPAWRLIKGWRAERFAAQGDLLLARGRLSEAYDKAILALQLRPGQARQIRLMAEVLTRTGASSGLEYWKRLIDLPEVTEDQRQGYVDFALTLDQPGLAVVPLKQLLGSTNPSPRTLILAARHHLLLNDTSNALHHARALQRREPESPADVLAMAAILQSRPEPECRRTSEELLWHVARGTSPYRLDAVEALVVEPTRSREHLGKVMEMLSAVAGPGLREQVLLADVQMRLDPARMREIALAALPRLAAKTDEEYLAVVQWLHRYELFGRSAEFLTATRAQASRVLFRLRLAAMIGIGQVSAAYRETQRPNPAQDPLDLELDRYRLAVLLKDDDAVANHRSRLMQLANQDSVRLRRMAEFAQEHRLTELAVDAWKSVSNDRFEARRAYRAISGLVDGTGDTWGAREAAQRLARLEPDDAPLRLQVAHYDLLLGENIATALSTADGLIEHPAIGRQARFVAALANLKLGRFREARALLPERIIGGDPVPIHWRSILVPVLAATNDEDRARALALTLTLADLRPEERELVRPHLEAARADR